MTIDELINGLNEKGYKVAFDHFTEDVKPPFVVVLDSGTDNQFADNRVYKVNRDVSIELYTRQKHESEYMRFEQSLNELGLCWNCEYHIWIDEEKLMDSRYGIN